MYKPLDTSNKGEWDCLGSAPDKIAGIPVTVPEFDSRVESGFSHSFFCYLGLCKINHLSVFPTPGHYNIGLYSITTIHE